MASTKGLYRNDRQRSFYPTDAVLEARLSGIRNLAPSTTKSDYYVMRLAIIGNVAGNERFFQSSDRGRICDLVGLSHDTDPSTLDKQACSRLGRLYLVMRDTELLYLSKDKPRLPISA